MKTKIIASIIILTSIIYVVFFAGYNNQPSSNYTFITNNQYNHDNQVSNNTNQTVKLPGFGLKLLNNTEINTQDIQSDNIVIHFWASWCNICTSEFNDIVKFAKQHQNTTILAISIDDDLDTLKKYHKNLNDSFDFTNIPNLIFAWDENRNISIDIFNTDMVPENYLVKHHNDHYDITEKLIGRADWENLL